VIFGCGAHFKGELRVATKWTKMDQNNLWTGTARKVHM